MMSSNTKPSLLLPCGATLSVFAALLEAAGAADMIAMSFALVGTATAFAAWFMYLRLGTGDSVPLGVRFFSIGAMALAISSLLYNAATGWLGWVGAIGLWLATLGAGVEWLRGRTYGTDEHH
jgi:hypothetical protein